MNIQPFTLETLSSTVRVLLRADGEKSTIEPGTMTEYRRALNAAAVDVVALRHLGADPLYVMLLDDLGHDKALPVNAEATRLYHANCKPNTTHTIRGDVVIAPDSDFA